MKKIVCELCEGTVFDKVDGRFVCKGCGTSYSVEEAKGMMQEVEGEDSVSTGSSVSVPQSNVNQQQIENLLILASNAYEASNNAETENYCNQAITMDATSYKAWLLKGKAVGWSSTLGNPRVEEAAHSFCKAIEFAPEDEKENIASDAVDELKRLGLAMIATRKSNFAKYPDDDEYAGFAHDRKILLSALVVLLSNGYGETADMLAEYEKEIASLMNQAAVAGFETARDNINEEDHPNEYAFKRYLNQAGNCAQLLRDAIDASDDDDDEDITRYENLIIVLEDGYNRCSYTREWNSYTSSSYYAKEYSLNDSAVAKRKEEVRNCKKAIEDIKKAKKAKEEAERKKAEEEKQKRIAAYWEAHADEKAALESELKELETKRATLVKEIDSIEAEIKAATPTGNVPSEDEKAKIKDQIGDLNNRRAKLGLFAGKEKKQIGEEIATLEGRLSALEGKIEEEKKARKAESDQKLAPLTAKKKELSDQKDAAVKRITAINKELTKDPEE